MTEKNIQIRLNHNGQFRYSSYEGGEHIIASDVGVDTFSYTVLMEFVKDYLHYTEIGGIYINKEKGGWELVTNDKELFRLVEDCNDGGVLEFCVDNIVDKDIQPLKQMQPHVIVRPRKNIIQVSPKKTTKRTFITRQQLQQQNQCIRKSPREVKRQKGEDVVVKEKESATVTKNQGIRKSPREGKQQKGEDVVVKEKESDTMTKNQCIRKSPRGGKRKNEEDDVVNEKKSATVRRKLNLPNNKTGREKSGESEVVVQKPPLTQYEIDKISRVQRNDAALAAFGVPRLAANLRQGVGQSKNVEEKNSKDLEDDEYDPRKEAEAESEDTSESVGVSKARKSGVGLRTRSRAKSQGPADIEIERESTHVIAKKAVGEKEVTSSYRAPILKPTCTKVLTKTINGEVPGSIGAYMAYRRQETLNTAPPSQEQDVPELHLEETTVHEVVKAPRKPRGPTKMATVHRRTAEEKVVIMLNEAGQPVSDNHKVTTELSNFVGTIARDNVSLAYVNWHLVPETLKEEMWLKILARYVIPAEGRKWVDNTLNCAWRVYKSRFKAKYYTAPKTEAERLALRPDDISLEDFRELLNYWGDKKVKKLAKENSANRKLLTETHTLGPKTLAQKRGEMKMKDPKLTSPSDAEVFVESRKRKEGRTYKSNVENLEKRLIEIKKLIDSGKETEANQMVNSDKAHARDWLVGRGGKKLNGRSSRLAEPIPTDHYVQELTAKIKRDLEIELEAKVNRKVQENMTWVLKKLGDANPDLKLDIGDFCVTVSSDQDDNGTPMTQGGETS